MGRIDPSAQESHRPRSHAYRRMRQRRPKVRVPYKRRVPFNKHHAPRDWPSGASSEQSARLCRSRSALRRCFFYAAATSPRLVAFVGAAATSPQASAISGGSRRLRADHRHLRADHPPRPRPRSKSRSSRRPSRSPGRPRSRDPRDRSRERPRPYGWPAAPFFSMPFLLSRCL